MDELTLLREMRADVPPPGADVVAAARARITRRPRRRGVRVGIAVAAGMAVLALPVVSLDRTPRDAAAADVLRRASRAAATQPAGTGAYWYARSRGSQTSTHVRSEDVVYTARETTEREAWFSRDGGRISTRLLGWEPVGPRDRELASRFDDHPEVGGPPREDDLREPPLFSFGEHGLTWDELFDLPTDAGDLYDDVKDAADGKRSQMFVIVGDLLRESPAPPELRAALYEVAARVRGVRHFGEVTDPLGRRATAVGFERDGDGTEQRLLLDPGTGELLAEETRLTKRVDWVDAEPGTLLSWNAYEATGYVGGIGVRP